MKLETGGRALCAGLERLGVTHIFGLPGTQNVDLFEELRRSSIRTVLATHEMAAAFMANGYYRASGKPGVLTTIPGPGFAFAVAGIAEASADSAALLYIVGKPAAGPARQFNLQAIDQSAMLAPLVRRTIDVDCADEVASGVSEAYAATTAGEPGPVMLHIGQGVLAADTARQNGPHIGQSPVMSLPEDPLVAEAVRLLRGSRRPVFFVGQGANGAAQRLRELAESLQAPVIATRSARGILPEDHPLAMIFDSSDAAVSATNWLLDRSDLIVAVGCKFSHNGTGGFRLRFPREKLVHADASAGTLNANYPARLAVCADSGNFLDALVAGGAVSAGRSGWTLPELENCKRSAADRTRLAEPAIYGVDPPTPAGFFAALSKVLPADSCLVTDSGWHQVLATRHFRVRSPRGLIIPSDFQSMGFGLPAAIGAKLAAPHRTVVALIGDGGLAMSGLELLTAVREKVAITVIVFNDGALGQIRLQQRASYGRSHATELNTPDLALFARAVGANYIRLEGDSAASLRAALESDSVTLVEVLVGDNFSTRIEQSKGVARQVARRMLKPSTLAWVKSRLGR